MIIGNKKFLGIVVLGLLFSSTSFAEVNFKKFGSVFKNPIKWLKTLPLNEIKTNELIKELGTPDDMIELEGTKYLSYKWGTTVTSIVFFVKDGIIYDARYDPEHKSTLTMKALGGLGFKTGKSVLASELAKDK